MKYFGKVKSYEELKEVYRNLLKANHPDNGGNEEIMKEINVEFDIAFRIWKDRRTATAIEEEKPETADSIRNEFYTQNGWKGKNHNWNRTLKEVAQIVRGYVKEKYPTCKFSVRTSYASMCQELHVSIKEFPAQMYKTGDDLRREGLTEHVVDTITWGDHCGETCEYDRYTDEVETMLTKLQRNDLFNLDSWTDEELITAYEEAAEKSRFYAIKTEYFQSVIDDVNSFVKSYNYEDCDGMIDYFNVDFYYFGVSVDECKQVERVARIKARKDEVTTAKAKRENTATTEEAAKIEAKEAATEKKITSQEEPEAEQEEAATEEEPEARQEAEPEATEEAPATETIKAAFDGLPVVDTSTGEKVSDNAADMFSQLAAAYFQKKTIKSGKKAPEKAQEKPEEKQENQENIIDYSAKEMLYDCKNMTVFYAKNGVTEDTLKGVSDTGKELVFVAPECHLSGETMEENRIHFLKIGVDLPKNEIKLTGINEYARLAKVRIKAGYSGNNNDLLSDEERAELRQNNQVTVTREYYGKEYKKLYHTLNYVENVKLLYSASIEQDDSISPGKDLEYVGFIVGDRIITDAKPAFEKLKEDIERRIIELVPDEKTAASLLENPENEQQNNNYFLSQAREYFYKNLKPELAIYDGKPQGLSDLIEYFLHPEMVVDRYAKEYIESNKIYILKAWIRYNRTLEEYRKITSDLSREEHKILKISESVSDEKIVRLELRNKTEIKVEASAIKRMTYSNGTLSKWYIYAADRNKVADREIKIDDILTVKHGSKVLYKSA